MRSAVLKLVLTASWSLTLACAVYDPSLLKGHGFDDARGGSPGAGNAPSGGGGGDAGANGGGAAATSGAAPSGGEGGDGDGPTGGGASAGAAAAGTGGAAGAGGDGPGAGGGGNGGDGPTGVPLVFDTMEDGNLTFILSSSLHGRWYLSNDGSDGEQTTLGELMAPIPEGRGDSEKAVHTTASGFTGWGASVGFTFENESFERVPFDASAFSAVSFYAKVESGSATSVRVTFPDMNTDPMGEVCGTAETGTEDCLNHFGADLELTTEFTEYVLEFGELAQRDWGHLEPSLDASQLLGMEVSWGTAAVDLWLDDVVLLP